MSELSLRFLYLSTSLPISASVRGSMLAADGSCCLSSVALFADFFRLFAIAKPPLQLVMLRKTA